MPRGAFRKPGAASSSPTRAPETPGSFVRQSDYESERRPYGLPDIIQRLPGQLFTPEGLFIQPTPLSSASRTAGNADHDSDSESSNNMDVSEDESVETGAAYEKQQDKKRRQWQKWSEVTIPAMLKPYLELLRVTDSLRDISHVRGRQGCTGCHHGRMLEVSCIYFDSML